MTRAIRGFGPCSVIAIAGALASPAAAADAEPANRVAARSLGASLTMADAKLQEGRVAMTVRCPESCELGVRLLNDGDRALYVSLAGSDYGSAYLQTLGEDGQVASEELLFESQNPSPFPSADPVYVDVGLMDGLLNAWADGRRMWGFWKELDMGALPEFGSWAIVHEGASVETVVFENALVRPGGPARTGDGFTARQLSDLFYSETVSIADVNHDGAPDVVAGPFYYLGPDFTAVGEIYSEEPTRQTSYSSGMLSATDDFNGDGWDDVLILESGRDHGKHQAILYLNPQGEMRHWDRSVALETTQGEASAYEDVDGDGRRDLVVIRENTVGVAHPGGDPREPWIYTPVSEETRWNAHGVGVGDVDGDGRADVLHASGWFKQPDADGGAWTHMPAGFGPGAQIHVEDLNGDGRSDVVGSLDGHGWGLAWWEQTQDGGFTRHLIMGDPAQTPPTEDFTPFSEPHAVAFADLDGDGLTDIVSGKRWWAHRDSYLDPDGQGAPVLYAFLQRRNGDAVSFTPHFIGDHVGVGNQIAIADLNGDGRPDIAASARKGTFVYFNDLD